MSGRLEGEPLLSHTEDAAKPAFPQKPCSGWRDRFQGWHSGQTPAQICWRDREPLRSLLPEEECGRARSNVINPSPKAIGIYIRTILARHVALTFLCGENSGAPGENATIRRASDLLA